MRDQAIILSGKKIISLEQKMNKGFENGTIAPDELETIQETVILATTSPKVMTLSFGRCTMVVCRLTISYPLPHYK